MGKKDDAAASLFVVVTSRKNASLLLFPIEDKQINGMNGFQLTSSSNNNKKTKAESENTRDGYSLARR